MAFGFFKKTQTAQSIFYHGHIFTHDEAFPWADAVACADGRIIAVGDFEAMTVCKGPDTQLIDLNGKYLFPGFIDVHRSPVMRAFFGEYADLTACDDAEAVCNALLCWMEEHSDRDVIFGYGYPEDCAPEVSALNALCADKPLLLLSGNNVNCVINSVAATIVNETAEEECVEIITPAYVLNLLMPFDFAQIEERIVSEIELLSDQGITTVLNLSSPAYLEGLYQDCLLGLYNEGRLRQRFFGTYLLNRPLSPQSIVHQLMRRKTNCMEMGQLLEARTLHLLLDEQSAPSPFPQDALNEIVLAVADKGFSFYLEAATPSDLQKAYLALEVIRDKGYKNVVTIASDCTLNEETRSRLERCDEVLTTWAPNLLATHPLDDEVSTVADAIDALTDKAAAIIGIEAEAGIIEKGRLADFAIFDENPLACDMRTFRRLHAVMTVVGGEIVYDVEEENMIEMYDLMSSQHI